MVGPSREDGLQLGLQLLLRTLADRLTADHRLSRKLRRWLVELVTRVLVLVAPGTSYRLLLYVLADAFLASTRRRTTGRFGFAGSGFLRWQGKARGRADRLGGAGYVDTRAPFAGQLATDRTRQLAVG